MGRGQASAFFLGAALIAVVGCGSKGTISGKVTYKGKSLASGSVSVIASDNIQYVSAIAPDGTYSIANVPTGPARFTVTSPNPGDTLQANLKRGPSRGVGDLDSQPAPPPQPAPGPGGWFSIPDKYGDPDQSGLTGTVGSPKTNIDLELQ